MFDILDGCKTVCKQKPDSRERRHRQITQLWILVKKNLLIQRRHPWQSLLQFLIPAFLGSLLHIGRVKVERQMMNETVWEEFSIDTLYAKTFDQTDEYFVTYTPHTQFTEKIINMTCVDLTKSLVTYDFLGRPFHKTAFTSIPFNTVESMETFITTSINDTNKVFIGVQFYENSTENEHLNYSLRPSSVPRSEGFEEIQGRKGWITNILFPQRAKQKKDPFRSRTSDPKSGDKPHYFQEGFLTAQHFIDLNFMLILSDEKNVSFNKAGTDFTFQRFPHPKFMNDDFVSAIEQQLPFLIMLCFIYLGQQAAKSVALEKESRLKEYMLMMGLSRSALWASHFIHYTMMLTVSISLVTFAFCYPFSVNGAIINYTHWTVVLVFLWLYGISLICMGFMISTWFRSANATSAGASILIFIFYIPYGFINQNLDGIRYLTKLIVALSSPVAMSLGCSVISSWESRAIGVQWSNLRDPVSASAKLSMFDIFMMLLLDSLLYFIFACYVDIVKPGTWGIGRPWYFCFQPTYWSDSFGYTEPEIEPINGNGVSINCERLDSDCKAGFQLESIVKEFKIHGKKGKKRVVDRLSFVAPKNQITVLLGHNGAGKSTTMNMLSGMLSADKGRCFVGDVNVNLRPEAARKLLGLCPQYNILIPEMTVSEHLHFFAGLKGQSPADAAYEIRTLADDIQLGSKLNEYVTNLSGGMQRKLSLGIAVCGGSKYVILDEPSSGIDARARKELWTILEKYRSDRTLLISTHYMDEAEALADRIVIIANGKLQCDGSIPFLKDKLGKGYHLTFSLTNSSNIANITSFLTSYGSHVTLEKCYGNEVQYLLPYEMSNEFSNIFDELKVKKDDLCIANYGLSITTMDEIFMKVTSDALDGSNNNDEHSSDMYSNIGLPEELKEELSHPIKLLSGSALLRSQFLGAFIKCKLHATRNWKIIFMQLALPTFMVIISIVQILTIPKIGHQPELDLSLRSYKDMSGLNVTTVYTTYDAENYGKVIESAFLNDANIQNLTTSNDGPKLQLAKWIPTTIESQMGSFNDKYILAMEVSNSSTLSVRAWFNAQAYHALPSAVLYADRILLQSNFPNARLSTSNYPLPPNSTQSLRKNSNFAMQGGIIVFNLIIGMMVMFSAFGVLPVRERKNGVKTLEYCSGAPVWLMWLAEYSWDIINCIPSIVLICLTFLLGKQVDGINTYIANLDCLIVLLGLFVLAQLPFLYCCSFLFQEPSSAITYNSSINVVAAIAPFITIVILRVPQLELLDTARVLNKVFCVLPQFNLAMGLFDLYFNSNILKICVDHEMLCEANLVPFSLNKWSLQEMGIGRYCLALALEIPLFFGVLALIEYEINTRRFSRYFTKLQKLFNRKQIQQKYEEILLETTTDNEDDDIVEIRKTLSDQTNLMQIVDSKPLVVSGLWKHYDQFTAVKGISFYVEPNECFGLLGPNGAGKTSTFKMITGEHAISDGTAYINKYNVITDHLSSIQQFGYCPQFDALLEQLTARETLIMYSRLRGVPPDRLDKTVNTLITLLGIQSFADQKVFGYSGGTKRKLSVAIAMVGYPAVLILDEPSCGLDPGARRQLWNVIKCVQEAETAILLTSHSMEECAALCDRLAILVDGSLKCIGGQQHLKSKYGNSIDVEIHAERSVEYLTKLRKLLKEQLPMLIFKRQCQNSIKYECSPNICLAELFRELQNLKTAQHITSYTVNQANIEQIFMKITRS